MLISVYELSRTALLTSPSVFPLNTGTALPFKLSLATEFPTTLAIPPILLPDNIFVSSFSIEVVVVLEPVPVLGVIVAVSGINAGETCFVVISWARSNLNIFANAR